MTFWQDARPASPRFRMPRRGSRRRRRIALVLVAVLVTSVAITLVRSGSDGTAKAAVREDRTPPTTRPGHVPPRWSRTLPDWAAWMLTDHGDAIVIGDDWVSAVALSDGRLRWQRKVARVEPSAVVRGDTILLAT